MVAHATNLPRDYQTLVVAHLDIFGVKRSKPAGLRTLRVLPPYLKVLTTGEVFESKENCYQHPQDWALFQGSAADRSRKQRQRPTRNLLRTR
jgi:hypothetical protein